MTLLILSFLTLLLLGASAFFSASETALFSIRRERLIFFETNPRKSHQRVFHLIKDGQRTMMLILLGNNFVNITLTGIIYSLLNQVIGAESPLLTMIVATLIIVIFGEVLPKNIALKQNESIASFISFYLYHMKVFLGPVLSVFQKLNQFFLSRFKKRLRQPTPYITLDELKTGIFESARSGAISSEEQRIITGILSEGSQPVRKLMIHRSFLQVVTENLTVSEAIEKLIETKQSFLLVRTESHPEQILGLASINALLKTDPGTMVRIIVENLIWVPESMEIAELVRYLFEIGNDKACILDEFGAFCGVFSLSIGVNRFFENVFPVEPVSRKGIATKTMMFSGAQDIANITDWLPEILKKSGFEVRTLNGVLTNYLGKIPKTGDRFVIEGWNFYIILANPTRIESVMIRKKDQNEH